MIYPFLRKSPDGPCRGFGLTVCPILMQKLPERFVEAYGDRLQPRIQLQGVHDYSLGYVVSCLCSHERDEIWRRYLKNTEWRHFVRENRLREGQELQFSLVADSYFKVRHVH